MFCLIVRRVPGTRLGVRECSSSLFWPAAPQPGTTTPPAPVTALLCGFAGSAPRQLAAHTALYTGLGCHTVNTILPLELLFHWDTAALSAWCGRLASALQHNLATPDLVLHCLSNNGAAVYQHVSPLLTRQGLRVRGAVLDSAPGPGTLLQNILPGAPALRPAPSRPMLICAYPAVNLANGRSVGEMVRRSKAQLAGLGGDRATPWPGPWLDTDTASHPLLFLYSRRDRQIPWRYVERVAGSQAGQGRPVTRHCFPGSDHVAHLKHHPVEYKEAVSQFLLSLQTDHHHSV